MQRALIEIDCRKMGVNRREGNDRDQVDTFKLYFDKNKVRNDRQ